VNTTILALKKNSEFQTVYKKGKSFANKHIVMFVLKNNKGINRLGISASKKIGKAVVRNRQRRRLKEAFKELRPEILTGHDIVILPRESIIGADFSEIRASTKRLLQKHGLWRQNV
jgi:ribonuclease P protein component